ncbi:MAG: fd1 [Akkermansiaceae bacterium]|nr:fd1 [Akkermansiaceae bacterium]
MASRAEKNPRSVAGRYYVDQSCIDCDLCRETAPGVFARCDESGASYVSRQPADAEEETRCREAMEGCPVEAIGDDGDS